MSILAASKLNYELGVDVILQDVTFNVNKGDRVGIVGVNGAGKSTLLKLIVGEYEPTDGEIFISRGATLGYLKQREHFDAGQTVLEVMDRVPSDVKDRFAQEHGYEYSRAVRGILTSMGFDESYYGTDVGVLSGGEKTRLALCALLVTEPDILLLDEPTNHLDLPTLAWLESYLKSYRGTLLIVSHDRYFLDKCVNKIFEIENCTLKTYNGNYTSYKEQKQRNYEIDLKHYEHQMEEIERQEEIIRRFKEHNTEHLVKRAQSREKRLAHITRPVKPTQLKEALKINFDQKLQSGNDVVLASGLSFGYGNISGRGDESFLFHDVDLDIKKGDRVCIVGSNGIGKTTLLKILLGELYPSSGRVILGTNVMPGYYDQEQKNLHPSKTVLDEIHSEYVKYNETDLRKLLGGFLFHGDDVFKTVGDLAGGEKARLSLLKLMMSGCNLLIFDEPTNHLDISAKEVFEEAIKVFPGTVIIVSHDRYLLQHIPDYIIELTSEGAVKYLGNFDYYDEKRKSLKAKPGKLRGDNLQNSNAATDELISDLRKVETWEEKKAREREERKQAKALEAAYNNVTELEAKIKELETKISNPAIAVDAGKLYELAEALDEAKADLDVAMEEWLNLQ